MPPLVRYYEQNHAHFITASTYHRARLFDAEPCYNPTATHRVWQRRFYDLNIWSEARVREKLKYRRGNPVRRGLVPSPEQWLWSSFRYYHLEGGSLIAMDRLL